MPQAPLVMGKLRVEPLARAGPPTAPAGSRVSTTRQGVTVWKSAGGPRRSGSSSIPPVLVTVVVEPDSLPPQTIIREPVQTAVWKNRVIGAPVRVGGAQSFATASSAPLVLVVTRHVPAPPHTIIREPVQTAVWY